MTLAKLVRALSVIALAVTIAFFAYCTSLLLSITPRFMSSAQLLPVLGIVAFIAGGWLIFAAALVWSRDSRCPRSLIVANPLVHTLILVTTGAFGFRVLHRPIASIHLVSGVIAVAAMLALSVSIYVQVGTLRRIDGASWHPKLSALLNAVGVLTTFAAMYLVISHHTDLELGGIIVLLGGAALATLFIVLSALVALAGSVNTAPSASRTMRRAVGICGAAIAMYTLAAVYFFPVSAAVRRSLGSSSMEGVHVREVATLSSDEADRVAAQLIHGQYWGGFCCVGNSDGTRIAYVKPEGDREVVYVDGRPSGDSRGRMQMEFSPDGKHFAYSAKGRFVVDGEDAMQDRDAFVGSFAFSPDSSRVAYLVVPPEGRQLRAPVVVLYVARVTDQAGQAALSDRRVVARSSSIRSLRFSPNSQHLLFVEALPGPFDQTSRRGLVRFVLHVDTADHVLSTIDHDGPGNAVAWFADHGDRLCTAVAVTQHAAPYRTTFEDPRVLDLSGARVDAEYDAICRTLQPMLWSPSDPWHTRDWTDHEFEGPGGHRVRITAAGSLMRLEIDARPQPYYDFVWPPTFTVEGKELRYGAVDRGRLIWVRVAL
jgi:hypothetical protein